MSCHELTFRVFVSSTFSDLIAERNVLQEHVFKDLREYCRGKGARFQAIDLRWGVSEEAALDQQTMDICIQELKRCRDVSPRLNFIVLLGGRYGWRPLPPRIEAQEFQSLKLRIPVEQQPFLNDWYRRDDNAVPPHYYLQPRKVNIYDCMNQLEKRAAYEAEAIEWEKIAFMLRTLLHQSAKEVFPDPNDPRRRKYEYSATHQEIRRGVFESESPRHHAFAYFRTIEELPEDDRAKKYRDIENGTVDVESRDRLVALKKKIRSFLPSENVYEYSTGWKDLQPGSIPGVSEQMPHLPISQEYLQALCDRVKTDLRAVIDRELMDYRRASDLDREIESHNDFGKDRGKHFIGREDVLDRIRVYLSGESSRPLVVYGVSGSGKTALMARTAGLITESQKPGVDPVLICRYVGATSASSDIRSLLESLCRELARTYGDGRAVPGEFRELTRDFPRRLLPATAERPLSILLDALDQLSPANDALYLAWLPRQLPPHVKLIVSVLDSKGTEGECYRIPQKMVSAENKVQVDLLPGKESEKLLDAWLMGTHRRLQPEQRREVLDKFAANGLPLYLKLAFTTARHWKSYEPPPSLDTDVTGIVNDMLTRLENERNHGYMLTSRFLGYLGAGRHGLTEEEILDLLSEDKEVMDDLRTRSSRSPKVDRLPFVIWSRLHAELEPYLSEYRADNTTVISFYHRQVGETVANRYLNTESGRGKTHGAVSKYFERRWREPYIRALSELPYHVTEAKEGVERILCDLLFIEAKARAGKLFELLRDYDRAIDKNTLPCLVQVRKAVSSVLPYLSSRPALTLQSIYNRLTWFDGLEPRLLRSLKIARSELDGRSFWLSAKGPLPDSQIHADLNVRFETGSSIQALAVDRPVIAVASYNGEVEFRDLTVGEQLYHRRLDCSRIAGIALDKGAACIAYIDTDGLVRTERSSAYMRGRKEKRGRCMTL